MRRFVPSILAIFAVLGLTLTPGPIVHAHEDGHDAHGHGTAPSAHARLHGHEHAKAPEALDDDDHPRGGNAPVHHVHLDQAPHPIARLRGPDAVSGGLIDTAVALAPIVGLWAVVPSRSPADDAVPQRGRGGPRVDSRSLDRLLWIGSLLI